MAALALLIGCSSQGDETTLGVSSVESIRAAGQLRLPLVTPGPDQYRLRSAAFDVTTAFGGPPVASIGSESDPNAAQLSLDLPPGDYVVTLASGWFLEHLAPDGSASPVSAGLLSPSAQPFTITENESTQIVYRFSTIAGPIELGGSELVVRAEVVPAVPLPDCDVLDPLSCPAGQTCLVADNVGTTFCAQAGSLPVGSTCNAEQCVAGAQCMYSDPANPGSGVCTAFCATAAPPPGCDCRALSFDAARGVCEAGGGGCDTCTDSVLVAGAPADSSWNEDVREKLLGTGAFLTVDIFDVGLSTPTLAELQPYDAVLVYSDRGMADPTAMGDTLATYFDLGGRVVVATFANASVPLAGRWAAEGYQLVEPNGQTQPAETAPLIFLEPGSPLLAGVESLTAGSAFRSNGGPINGGISVAAWGSGAPLIVRGARNGRAFAALNMYPPSADVRSDLWIGSGAEILRNALLFQ